MRFYEKVMRFYEIEACYNAGKSQEKAKSLHFFISPPWCRAKTRARAQARQMPICKLFRFLKCFAFLGKTLQKYGRSADISREIRCVLSVPCMAADPHDQICTGDGTLSAVPGKGDRQFGERSAPHCADRGRLEQTA